MYRGWPKIIEQIHIVDIQCPLSTSGKNTHIPWFISFPMSVCRLSYVEREARYNWLPKSMLCTPTTNDRVHGEREKWFFWLLKPGANGQHGLIEGKPGAPPHSGMNHQFSWPKFKFSWCVIYFLRMGVFSCVEHEFEVRFLIGCPTPPQVPPPKKKDK